MAAISSSLKRLMDDELDSSTDDENFECENIDTSGSSETEESDIESSSDTESEDNDDGLGSARDWCEMTTAGRLALPHFPFTGCPGTTFSKDKNYTPVDIFEMFLDSDLTGIIVKETNKFAEQERRTKQAKVSRFSRSKQWKPTNEREIKLFIGLLILQGIVCKPYQSMYWSKRRVLHTPLFSKVMPVNRFILLSRYLHFCDNEGEKKEDCPNPKLWKLYNDSGVNIVELVCAWKDVFKYTTQNQITKFLLLTFTAIVVDYFL